MGRGRRRKSRRRRSRRKRRKSRTATAAETTTAAAPPPPPAPPPPQPPSLSSSRITGCNKLWITQRGDCLKAGTEISFCQSSKRCETPHINKDSLSLCVDVFHRNFSSAGGTDQRILPATFKQTSQA